MKHKEIKKLTKDQLVKNINKYKKDLFKFLTIRLSLFFF